MHTITNALSQPEILYDLLYARTPQAEREGLSLGSDEVLERLGKALARKPRQTRSAQRSPRALNHLLPPGERSPRSQSLQESLRKALTAEMTPKKVKKLPRGAL
jgi:hypothetical protein